MTTARRLAPRFLELRAVRGGGFVGARSAVTLCIVLAARIVLAVPVSVASPPSGLEKIEHVIVIVQENRSFDHYFGTFPGAEGIPMANGVPTVCAPDTVTGQCVKPFHSSPDGDVGGPHRASDAETDVNGGAMDGFIRSWRAKGCQQSSPVCTATGPPYFPPPLMRYHDDRDIPNYWTLAREYVLQDHLFSSFASWSLPNHLALVSGWSAVCTSNSPMSCREETETVSIPDPGDPLFAWTDLTYLLHQSNVSWAYYVFGGGAICDVDDATEDRLSAGAAAGCAGGTATQSAASPSIWNPLPWFVTVRQNGQAGNVQDVANFFTAASTGTLPAVAWVVPNRDYSEHPPATTQLGEAYVTSLVNAVMRGPNWDSTAIFITWDDWGGFYDHVPPPVLSGRQVGIRVPGLTISPYAKRGYIDRQILSFDAYLKFIEDVFLGGQRLDPATDGRPDPRPSVRENALELGDLVNEFDFTQPPRAPIILPTDFVLEVQGGTASSGLRSR